MTCAYEYEIHLTSFQKYVKSRLGAPFIVTTSLFRYLPKLFTNLIMTEATESPLSGLWMPTQLQKMYYGPSKVENELISCLPSSNSKAFIITGSSLATKTPLVKKVEQLLTSRHHAGTYSSISQHAPIAQIDEAVDAVTKDSKIDTLISIGGGSPIDAAKAISHRTNEKTGEYLFHISIPTTLSSAETSMACGMTNADGTKVLVSIPQLVPQVIIYDADFALQTPQKLWLSTGIRALDHAVELMYNPNSVEIPTKVSMLSTIKGFFEYLPQNKKEPKNKDVITMLQLLSFVALYPMGLNAAKGGIGLSHTMGYALGAPFGIPHGITSCLALAEVVRFKAREGTEWEAQQIARIAEVLGESSVDGLGRKVPQAIQTVRDDVGNDYRKKGLAVAEKIEKLIKDLELATNLRTYGVEGEDKIHQIVKSTTKSESGELYDRIYKLVESIQ